LLTARPSGSEWQSDVVSRERDISGDAMLSRRSVPLMRRRDLITLLAASAWAHVSRAETSRVPVVGGLANISPDEQRRGSLPRLLRGLGYIEGQNIRFEFRGAGGNIELLPVLAAELVTVGVNVIVAFATPATRAAQKATSTIPIVGVAMADPVGDGLVQNYASPEANITGNTFLGPELVPKRLGYLKELLPPLTRVGVLWHPRAYSDNTMKDMVVKAQQAAAALGITLDFTAVTGPADFEAAFASMSSSGVEALFEFPSQMLFLQRQRLIDLASTHRIPAMWNAREFVEIGGLIMYGASINDLSRRAAVYVDRILKGSKPSELPIELPTKFELLINTTAAKALGITVPPSLLARADEVFE
jgi:putative ABC transport system substrate-binding protein